MIDEVTKKYFIIRDKIIERNFQYLDEEQKKAVLSNERNELILACPGSGKTTVLINKVLYLMKYGNTYKSSSIPKDLKEADLEIMEAYFKDRLVQSKENIIRIEYLLSQKAVNPNNIVVITFTKAAAINMKKRFQALNKSKKTPFFGTFHGLFYKILINYFGKINMIESLESYKLIFNVLANFFDEVSEERINEIRNYISLFKCSNLTMEEFEPQIDKQIFINCYNAYENYKNSKGLLDFDDLQINCMKLFQKNFNVLEAYKRTFKYILIDEFQDSDNIQLNIIKMFSEKNCIFAVGDEDQCIYSFRGSRPDYMVDFDKHFKEGKKLYLSTNYRSPENVVSICNSLIKNNVMRNEKNMVAFKKENKRIEVLKYNDENSQADDISANIEKLKGIGGYNYRECCILYRTNIESRSIIDAFIRKKIPFKLMDKEYNFFEHFICKDIISYLRLSIFKDDIESFRRIINKPFRYVSRISLEKLRSSEIKEDCFEKLKAMESTPVFQIKNLEKLRKEIQNLNKMSLQTAIEYVITDLEYHDYLEQYSKKFKMQISEIDEILQEFKEASKPYNSIVTFLAHIKQTYEEIQKGRRRIDDEECVLLSTIHGVKGMEFKNVFIIDCVEEILPHVNNMDKNIEEERRLFYVAVTRTIDNVFLCVPRNIRAKVKEPSRFITECNINLFEDFQKLYKKGETVIHSSFGKGRIESIEKNIIEIIFENEISRRFDITVLHNRGIIKKLG